MASGLTLKMSRGSIYLIGKLYFTTSTVFDWIGVFARSVYKRIIVESLRYCQ